MITYEYRVLIHPDELKKLAVTCWCKVRTVFEVPGFLMDDSHPFLLVCPTCKQNYVVDGRKVIRVDKDLLPETGNGLMQKATATVLESDDETLDGKLVSPGNDQVN